MAMDEVYWSFDEQKYDSYETFVNAVSDYNAEIADDENDWDPEAVVCTGPCKVRYEALWKDEDFLLEVVISNEAIPITMGQLLYKLHADSHSFFEGADAHFFEGIEETEEGIYELYIGS